MKPDPISGTQGTVAYADLYAKSHTVVDINYVLGYADLPIIDQIPGYSMLDVGCGTGGYYQLLKNHARIIGLDFSEPMIQRAEILTKALGIERVEFVHTLFENFTTTDKFDVIRIPGVYGFYLPWTFPVMLKVKSLLNDNGLAVLGAITPKTLPQRFKKAIVGSRSRLIFERNFHRLLDQARLRSIYRLGLPQTDLFFVTHK